MPTDYIVPNTYTVGDLATLTATFTNQAGQPADPTTVTISVQAPDGTVTTPAATRVSTGVYQVQQSLTTAGVWRWKAVGTGAVQAASSPDQGQLEVQAQAF